MLKALGVDPELIRLVVRFSLGRANTDGDVDHLFEVLPEIMKRLRKE